MSLHQLNSKKILNGPVLLSKTILGHSNCFLLFVATNGKDRYRLIQVKKKVDHFFLVFMLLAAISTKIWNLGP